MDPLNAESSVPRRRDSDVYIAGVIIICTIEGGEEITNPSQIQSYEGFFFHDSKDFGQRRTLLAVNTLLSPAPTHPSSNQYILRPSPHDSQWKPSPYDSPPSLHSFSPPQRLWCVIEFERSSSPLYAEHTLLYPIVDLRKLAQF